MRHRPFLVSFDSRSFPSSVLPFRILLSFFTVPRRVLSISIPSGFILPYISRLLSLFYYIPVLSDRSGPFPVSSSPHFISTPYCIVSVQRRPSPISYPHEASSLSKFSPCQLRRSYPHPIHSLLHPFVHFPSPVLVLLHSCPFRLFRSLSCFIVPAFYLHISSLSTFLSLLCFLRLQVLSEFQSLSIAFDSLSDRSGAFPHPSVVCAVPCRVVPILIPFSCSCPFPVSSSVAFLYPFVDSFSTPRCTASCLSSVIYFKFRNRFSLNRSFSLVSSGPGPFQIPVLVNLVNYVRIPIRSLSVPFHILPFSAVFRRVVAVPIPLSFISWCNSSL
ncbi:hypothetical protein BC829DRAFT_398516 [Chytridium lagenaria]|nr:hypothetical protein BC829DRAFT_398516 [Chytridium lagenaria]